MELKTITKIKESESTLTPYESGSSEPKSTHRDEGRERYLPPPGKFPGEDKTPDIPVPKYPPKNLPLRVVMTFTDALVRLDVADAGLRAEGKTVGEAFGHLVAVVSDYIASVGGERADLLHFPPETWFKLVSPDQIGFANNITLIDRLISELNGLYEFKGDSVERFLEENASLGGLLFAAHAVIRQYFGSEVKAALEVVADPEALGDRQLFVLIRTELPRKEARAHLAELDRGWWLGALPAAEGKMEIALD